MNTPASADQNLHDKEHPYCSLYELLGLKTSSSYADAVQAIVRLCPKLNYKIHDSFYKQLCAFYKIQELYPPEEVASHALPQDVIEVLQNLEQRMFREAREAHWAGKKTKLELLQLDFWWRAGFFAAILAFWITPVFFNYDAGLKAIAEREARPAVVRYIAALAEHQLELAHRELSSDSLRNEVNFEKFQTEYAGLRARPIDLAGSKFIKSKDLGHAAVSFDVHFNEFSNFPYIATYRLEKTKNENHQHSWLVTHQTMVPAPLTEPVGSEPLPTYSPRTNTRTFNKETGTYVLPGQNDPDPVPVQSNNSPAVQVPQQDYNSQPQDQAPPEDPMARRRREAEEYDRNMKKQWQQESAKDDFMQPSLGGDQDPGFEDPSKP